MNNPIKELWHGNIIPQEDSRTNLQVRNANSNRNLEQIRELNPSGTQARDGFFLSAVNIDKHSVCSLVTC